VRRNSAISVGPARALALWLGLIALTLQALAPLCLGGFMAARTGGSPIVLCTSHGFETVRVDADGKPVPNAPAPDDGNSLCPLCSAVAQATHFTPPVPFILAAPLLFLLFVAEARESVPLLLRAARAYGSRAPPHLLMRTT
jgi:hypothetical protein